MDADVAADAVLVVVDEEFFGVQSAAYGTVANGLIGAVVKMAVVAGSCFFHSDCRRWISVGIYHNYLLAYFVMSRS